MRNNGTKPAPVVDDYNAKVDKAVLEQMSRTDLTGDELNKAIGNAIRWAGIKGKLILADHGSGFLDPEEE